MVGNRPSKVVPSSSDNMSHSDLNGTFVSYTMVESKRYREKMQSFRSFVLFQLLDVKLVRIRKLKKFSNAFLLIFFAIV